MTADSEFSPLVHDGSRRGVLLRIMRLPGPFILILLVINFCAIGIVGQAADEGLRSAPNDYRIKQGDKLSVKFFTNPDLNEPSVTVRPDGFISLQIISDIRAEGRTTSELKAALEKAYDETLLEPIITVAVLDFVAPRVYLAGQINKPGAYNLREAKTLMQAIFLAGGFTRDANRKMVVHARPGSSGDWTIQSSDALAMLDPKTRRKDIELRDGDYIYVPESRIAKFTRAAEVVRGLLPRIF